LSENANAEEAWVSLKEYAHERERLFTKEKYEISPKAQEAIRIRARGSVQLWIASKQALGPCSGASATLALFVIAPEPLLIYLFIVRRPTNLTSSLIIYIFKAAL
jgi:hypothetical protein